MIALLFTMMMYTKAEAEVPKISCRMETYKADCNTCDSVVCSDGTKEWTDETWCTTQACVKAPEVKNESN